MNTQEYAAGVMLENRRLVVAKIRETLQPGEDICNHIDPHIIKPVSGVEADFRQWLELKGWLSRGYCPTYYPMWLRNSFRSLVDPSLPILDEEPEMFGGKWRHDGNSN